MDDSIEGCVPREIEVSNCTFRYNTVTALGLSVPSLQAVPPCPFMLSATGCRVPTLPSGLLPTCAGSWWDAEGRMAPCGVWRQVSPPAESQVRLRGALRGPLDAGYFARTPRICATYWSMLANLPLWSNRFLSKAQIIPWTSKRCIRSKQRCIARESLG